MSWLYIPRDATRLWKPDRIELSLITSKATKSFMVVVDIPGDGSGYIASGDPGLSKGKKTFRDTVFIKITDPSLLARLWRVEHWRVKIHSDATKLLATLETDLPNEAAMQLLFSEMRADLSRYSTDPDKYCEKIVEAGDEQADIVTGGPPRDGQTRN